MEAKQKPSVYIAVFTLDERDGWCAPGIVQWVVGLSSAGRKLCLQIKHNCKPIDYARNCVARDFAASGFDWCFFVDNDMQPPMNLLEIVDRAEPHMSILAPRFLLFATCLAKEAKNPGLPLTLAWQPLTARPEKQEWCELAWCGAGAMFVHRSVFQRMSDPWFRFVNGADGEQINSEDVNFCQKARAAGFSVWGNQAFEVDHLKTVSLAQLARSIGAIVPSPLSELLARGIPVTGEAPRPSPKA